jgi:hypothetical protein
VTAAGNAASAQTHPEVLRARRAYEALDFRTAIAAAGRALELPLSPDDRIAAYEVLAYSYGVLDSAQQATAAFRELIFLDPDREPDAERVSPRITSLYALALGQILVIRRVAADTASFVAGEGSAPIRFELSRQGRAITRVVGPGLDVMIDSQLVAGATQARWRGLTPEGYPVRPGEYQVIVTAIEGRNEFSATTAVRVEQSPVDTLPHVTSLPGYSELPEMESPPRDWRPLGIAVLYAGLTSAATLGLEDTDLGGGVRPIILGVSVGALLTGFTMSVRKPDLRPVPGNIQFNRLLRERIAAENARIAQENDERRRKVTLSITPVERGAP